MGMSIPFSPEVTSEDFAKWKQAGIASVEFVLKNLDTPEAATVANRRSRQLRQWAEEAGVEIWSVHVPFSKTLDISTSDEEQRRHVVRRLVEMLGAYAPLKPQKLVLHASAEPIAPEEREARIAASRKSIAEMARDSAAMSAQIAVENLPRTCLGNTSREMLRLIDGMNNVGICLDTNHMLQESTEDFVRRVGPRIVTLHVSDFDAKDERHWLPGEGVIRWTAVIQTLQGIGYHGPFLFESRGTPEEKAACWRRLKEAVAAASPISGHE